MFCKKYKKEQLKDVKKIGVIISGLLGDILLRTPVLRALHDSYPQAEIVAITDPIGKHILLQNSIVKELIVIDRSKNNSKLQQNINKFQGILEIRKAKFDLIVNLYNGGSSHLMVLLSGARYKLGFCANKKESFYNVQNICAEDRLKDEQTLNNYMISIVEPLSEKKYPLHPVFEVSQDVLKEQEKFLHSLQYDRKKLYLLNLASSKEDKILEYKKYFELVEYIYKQYSYVPLIVSNPSQEYIQAEFVNSFMEASEIPYTQLETLSLERIGALIKLTDFLVTPDTGLMHLAMAFENYILTIFTYTHPIFVDPENERFISVYEEFDEGKLYQHQDISKEHLLQGVDTLFERV